MIAIIDCALKITPKLSCIFLKMIEYSRWRNEKLLSSNGFRKARMCFRSMIKIKLNTRAQKNTVRNAQIFFATLMVFSARFL